MKEYPLAHDYAGQVGFSADSTSTTHTFILPLLACDERMTNPETINVNPASASFTGVPDATASGGVIDNHLTYPGSVVNRIQIESFMNIPTAAKSETPTLIYYVMPIKWSFDVPYEVDDETVASTSITEILKITQHHSNKYISPDFSNADMGSATNSSTGIETGGAAGELTASQAWEGVDFDQDLFERILKFGSLKKLVKSTTDGGLKSRIIKAEDAGGSAIYENLWLTVPSKVKRQNKNTFYGLMIHVPLEGDNHQFFHGALSNISHLMWNFHVRYNEYHDLFNQAAA